MNHLRDSRRCSCVVCGGLLLCLLVAAWWYLSGSVVGQVSGIVRFTDSQVKSDEAVTWTVHFIAENGRRFTGLIDRGGQYVVKNVPPGPVNIAITGDPAMPPGLYAPKSAPPPFDLRHDRLLKRMAKYSDAKVGRLTHRVTQGTQILDIQLPD